MDKLDKLNLGCGESLLPGWINCDKVPVRGAMYWDVDSEQYNAPLALCYADSCDEIRSHGNLNEFKTDIVTMMNEFWRVLCNGGILDIKVAVIDNGNGAFRDPVARRYLHSQWVEYFYIGGAWERSGYGFGFVGKFEKLSNDVSGETHHVILKAVK